MAYHGVRDPPVKDDTLRGSLEVKGYELKPELRFNFYSKENRFPTGRIKRFLDTHISRVAPLPPPNKYALQPKDFVDNPKKAYKIYAMDRKTSIDYVI